MASYMNSVEDNQKWKDVLSKKHGIEMIEKLIKSISNNDKESNYE